MNLAQLLDIIGLSRDTYNTHVKRGKLDFMQTRQGDSVADRYSFWHLFALQVFFELFRSGRTHTAVASDWVTESADLLDEALVASSQHGMYPGWLTIQAPFGDDEPLEGWTVGPVYRYRLGTSLPQVDARTSGTLVSLSLYKLLDVSAYLAARTEPGKRALIDAIWREEPLVDGEESSVAAS